MMNQNRQPRVSAIPLPRVSVSAVTLLVLMAAALMLSACNTTAGAGRDVTATGAAITRGANDVKSGL